MHPCMAQPDYMDHAWGQPECMGTASGESCPIRCLPGYVPSVDHETWAHDAEVECIYGRFDRQPTCIGQPCDFTTAAPLNVGLQIFDDKPDCSLTNKELPHKDSCAIGCDAGYEPVGTPAEAEPPVGAIEGQIGRASCRERV